MFPNRANVRESSKPYAQKDENRSDRTHSMALNNSFRNAQKRRNLASMAVVALLLANSIGIAFVAIQVNSIAQSLDYERRQ